MRITILSENQALDNFESEHGLSFLVEIDNIRVIFDTGQSNLFLKNAKKLGVDLDKVQYVVLSHGHRDHANGLKHLSNKTLIAHPKVFTERFRKIGLAPLRMEYTKNEIQEQFRLVETESPLYLSPELLFLGEIPRRNDFESQSTPFVFKDGSPDFIPDDSALVAIVENELVIITGCSHAGICNICEYAMEITGINRIKAVMGGFHLKSVNQQTIKTIDYFKRNKPDCVYPSHCTSFAVNAKISENVSASEVKAGMTFNF